MFLLTLLIGSVLYVGHIWAVEWELKREWDPDGNGQLDNPTPETEKAMKTWASDTGRNVAGYFSVPVTFIWVGLNFALFGALAAIGERLMQKRTG